MPKIAVIPGDGIGPEVIGEALKVLDAVVARSDLDFEREVFTFEDDGTSPEERSVYQGILANLRDNFDAVLMGPINGEERFGRRRSLDLLQALRLDLNLFVNYFPVRLIEAKYCPLKTTAEGRFDFILLQDNLEGIQNGVGGLFKEGTDEEQVLLQTVFSGRGIRRLVRFAFELARRRGTSCITLCGQRSPASLWDDLMQGAARTLSPEFPDIAVKWISAERLISTLLKNPASFEIIVVCGTFGEMITHFASGLQGGAGVSAAADINPGKTCLVRPLQRVTFEPAGKSIANPLAAISAVALMLLHLGFEQESNWVDAAVRHALATDNVTGDLGGRLDSAQVGDFIADQIRKGAQ